MEVQQEQHDYLPEDDLSIDLDFDMSELGFLSPWRGELADSMGPDVQFGGGDADLEALLLGPAGDEDHPSLGDLEFAWF
uniref:Uncharacterized protein n=1 Tax=Arundo donax TaxID=35708 RepID=A0A0A9BBH8_ARUDO